MEKYMFKKKERKKERKRAKIQIQLFRFFGFLTVVFRYRN